MTVIAQCDASWGDWPARIGASWRESAAAIIETGRLLTEAKSAMDGRQFMKMLGTGLPFTKSTATRLMLIASDERLCAHVHKLPPSWGTLYELTKLDNAEFDRRLSDQTIRPDIERAEVSALRKAKAREPNKDAYNRRVEDGCTVDDLHKLIGDGVKYGAIYADPPWPYKTWSDKGQDRAPEQHYKTDPLGTIKSLPVPALASDNSVLHMWCVDWLLPGALEVITAWGFALINVGFVWVKLNPSGEGVFTGLGKWTRHGSELCLFATRGNPGRRDAGVSQVFQASISEHSRKPDEFHKRIERLTAGPYLELYGRRQRPGWTVWGNEIPRDDLQPPHDPDTGEVIEGDDPASHSGENLEIPAFLKRGTVTA